MAGFFSPSTLEQIRAASDIVDVIGAAIPLKRAGANFVALCPFHKEKSPSFNVNPQRQIFHCFGCHKGGDVFTFIREYESVDFVEAVKRLADRAHITLEFDQAPGEAQSRHLKDSLLQIHEQITQRWQSALQSEASGQVARDYLAKRGVSDEAVRLFRLGYAPDLWDDTVNWARSKQHDLALVERAGLILRKEGADHFYDRFRGRLMFPICDEQGRVIGFSGRILSGDEKTAKYVNSPETPIFTKSKVFFGLDKSKRALLDAGVAIVCEGQLDLIACFMGGVQNIVAPQGTAFTADHARILKRYAEEVVLCFDSDEAGQNAAVRSLDHLLASGLAVRVAVVPRPHDPDSFIKANGADAFRKLIDGAAGFFDYYLDRLCASENTSGDKGRQAVLRAMGEAVLKTGNAVLIDKYAQKTALRLGVNPESVRIEFGKIGRGRGAPAGPESGEPEEEDVPPVEKPGAQEYWLLKLMFLHEDLAEWFAGNLSADWIRHVQVREMVRLRLQAHRDQSWRGLAPFLDEISDLGMQSLLTEAVAEQRPIPNPSQQAADIALRLRNQHIDREMQDVLRQMQQPEVDDEARIGFLRRQQELRQMKSTPISPAM
ncbi:MAG: DNA primase [Verrucomicrobiota bacterium]